MRNEHSLYLRASLSQVSWWGKHREFAKASVIDARPRLSENGDYLHHLGFRFFRINAQVGKRAAAGRVRRQRRDHDFRAISARMLVSIVRCKMLDVCRGSCARTL